MHPSYFQILKFAEGDPKGSFFLPAEVSEWLFYVKFWDTINAELDANFGQYEDDTLSSDKLNIFVREIDKLRDNDLRHSEQSHNVVYGWTSEGKALQFSVISSYLKQNIHELRSFFCRAIENDSDVFCQL